MSQMTPSTGSDQPDDLPAGQPGDTKPVPGTRTAAPEPPTAGTRRPIALIVALAVAMAVIAALVAVLVWPSGDGDEAVTTPTTTLAPTTSATPTTERATVTTATPVPAPVDASTAVFPDASGAIRYDDPVDAARRFAVDFVGFTDPLVGEFLQGDARSGEVEVRATTAGPVTTVFVRQLGPDGTWWVLGAATGNIATDAPGPGEAISSPVTVSGNALTFEGIVNVEIRQDGARQPIGTGVVTGGGDVLRPFSGQIDYSTPTARYGAVVMFTRSAEDDRVREAAVLRVSFT